MEIIGCGKGHYYNPEQYSSCPECAKENAAAVDAPGVTEPTIFGNFPNMDHNIPRTEPIDFNGYSQFGQNMNETRPINNYQGDILSTDYFRDPSQNASQREGKSKVETFGATMPITPISPDNSASGVPFMPVVGWLVCIEGPAKGRDYRIHSQYNYIGRAPHMDICIGCDPFVTSERAAVIAYDPRKQVFSVAPGMSLNLVYLNDDTLLSPMVLKPYDELTIGRTKLLFVPFCGERFNWDDK